MALRKDKVAAALREMKGLCSSPDEPASLPNAINQLADILGDLFDDIAIDPFPPIDTGIGGLPEDAPFDFPLGGGGVPPFDPGGGFEGSPPGGGDGFGEDGGDGGEGGGGGDGDPCIDAYQEHVTLMGKTVGEISAAEGGIPGIGDVKIQAVVPENQLQLSECNQKCHDDFGKDIKAIDEQIKANQDALGTVLDGLGSTVTLSSASVPTPFPNANPAGTINLTGSSSDKIDELKRLKFEQEKLFRECLAECRKKDNKNNVGDKIVAGAAVVDTGEVVSVKNISCEVIEKDTQVVVSGLMWSDPNCGEDDLYVMVESCGCDEEEEE